MRSRLRRWARNAETAFPRGDVVCVQIRQVVVSCLIAGHQLADTIGCGVHPCGIGAEIIDHFLVQPAGMAWCPAVGRMDAGDVLGLARDRGWVAEIWVPLGQVNRRAPPEQRRQLLDPLVAFSELPPAVGLYEGAGEDELVARPVQVRQVPHREAKASQSGDDGILATAEVPWAERHARAHAVGVADDGLGVIESAVVLEEVGIRRPNSV